MKVLLLGFTKIAYLPYMHFYLNQLKKNHCEIHLLYWDRDGKTDAKLPEGIKAYRFVSFIKDSLPVWRKIMSFLKYRKLAIKILQKLEFDLVIVLHSTPGILLLDVLKRKYRNKYILDYRDLTYEHLNLYRYFISKLVHYSYITFVSSNAYRRYLPKVNKIYTSHNLILDSLEHRDMRRRNKRDVAPIRIRFWGLIRHKSINLKIMNHLANDSRFELHYHGRQEKTGDDLENYCKYKKIRNIFFHGAYKPEDRYEFAKETEILLNMYENDSKTTYAMGNKYYDGINFYLPQLCNIGSFMGKNVIKNQVGILLNPDSFSFADEIFRYYVQIDWTKFEKNCDRTLVSIHQAYRRGEAMIQKRLEEGKVEEKENENNIYLQ